MSETEMKSAQAILGHGELARVRSYLSARPAPDPTHRYALFAGEQYSQSGGWADLKRTAGNVEELAAWQEGDGAREWWHVVDLWTGEAVAANRPEDLVLMPAPYSAPSTQETNPNA